MGSTQYPLLAERTLPRPTKRMWRRWQDPSVLPDVPAGAVLVFRAGDRVETADESRLSGYEELLLDAVEVGVVDCRPRSLPVTVSVSSTGQAHAFPVTATFDVRVTDAVAVFRNGSTNLPDALATAMNEDEQLVKFNDRFDVGDVVSARAEICAYVMSAYRQRPPRMDGVRIVFRTVTVDVPEGMRPHVEKMQELHWGASEETLLQGQEQQRVGHVGSLMQTPQQARALAVAQQEMSSAEAARLAAEEEQRGIEMLRAEVWRMEDSGQADRDAIDRQGLIRRLDGYLTRSEPSSISPQRTEPRRLTESEQSIYIPADDDDD